MSDVQKLDTTQQPGDGEASFRGVCTGPDVALYGDGFYMQQAQPIPAGSSAGADRVGAVGTEAKVIGLIAQRQALGILKYGRTVAENPLPLRAWLQHQLEELLDAAIYCQRAIDEIDSVEGNK